MKSIEKQTKEDTKRLLRNQSCNTCAHGFFRVDGWLCGKTGSPVPLVHTCYKYKTMSIEDELIKGASQEVKNAIDREILKSCK